MTSVESKAFHINHKLPTLTRTLYEHAQEESTPQERRRGGVVHGLRRARRWCLRGFLRYRAQFREYLAEFFGTFLLIFLGLGSAVMGSVQVEMNPSSFDAQCLLWGLAVMLAVYVSGGVSGGHLNPVVTLTFACWRGFPWRKVLGYWFSQIFGAFCASGVIYSLHAVERSKRAVSEAILKSDSLTPALFVTLPDSSMANFSSFYGEALAAGCLMCLIFACIDRYNVPPTHCSPIVIGLGISLILGSLGSSGGLALNPAGDLGSRALLALVDLREGVVPPVAQYVGAGLIGPMVGGVVGGALYDLFIVTGPDAIFLEEDEIESMEKGEANSK